jgi:Fe-S-cluster containining protein
MEFDPIYEELEGQIAGVARGAGLACAPGCGACCRRPSRAIEASVAELRPLARHLWETGEAEATLDRAWRAGAEGWCVLYEPRDDGVFPRGRCGHYPFRPLTCRLFGFSAIRDKSGRYRPLLSAVMKEHDPGLPHRVEAALEAGLRPPVASEWRLRLAEVDPEAAVRLLPLNEALAAALEREGWAFRFSRSGPPQEAAP